MKTHIVWLCRAVIITLRVRVITIIAGLALIANSAVAQNPVVHYSDTWKWNIPASDPGVAWRSNGFDDSSWGSGPGLLGFETATLPSPGIQTAVGTTGSAPVTYLFRKTFNYTGSTTDMHVVIDQIVDDGVAYYLNGNLLGSVRYATGGAWNANASGSVGDAAEELNAVIAPAKGLIAGTNVITAEVHQVAPGGSDLVFGARVKFVAARPKSPGLLAVSFDKVTLSDNFWAPRITTNRLVSLPQKYQGFIDNHNFDNFPKTAGLMSGNHDGFKWADSDVYKTLEGMAKAIKLQPDSILAQQLESVINNIAAAQVASGPMAGYLNTYFQLGNVGRGNLDQFGNPIPGETLLTLQPWEDLQGAHEDYCAGHLIEAAVAHYESTGNTKFLNVARKYADHMASVFGPAPKRSGIPGHQEAELALFKLWSTPGISAQSDFDLAKFYLDERGRPTNGRTVYGEYCQDLEPIHRSSEPIGHCVRGPYMWAGATDVAAITNDTATLNALEEIWKNIVERKMYVTGGIGHRLYNEGFGPDYDLSNEWSYNETCGSCAMMMWTHRLANLRQDGKYTDILERIMYNNFAAGRSIDGHHMYYRNYMSRMVKDGRKGIDCCATNIVRTIPSIPGYQYATKEGDGIWAHLYIAGQATVTYNGAEIGLVQQTNYPWDGSVKLIVNAPAPTSLTLHLRIPAWAAGATASINNTQNVSMTAVTKGYLPITRTWNPGDFVQLNLPMTPRREYSHANVRANQGRTAIVRGPMVFCLESYDNTAPVHKIVIPQAAGLTATYDAGFLGGSVKITGTGTHADNGTPVNFIMIPYAIWDNRDPLAENSKMLVMVPETAAAAPVPLDQGQVGNAIVTYSHKNPSDSTNAPKDGIWPKDAHDQTIPRFTWWSHKGIEEWIQYEFPQAISIWRSDIYWYNDNSETTFPQSFRHEYWDGSVWKPMQLIHNYGGNDLYANEHYSVVRFYPVTTTRIRLYVQLQPNKSAGILEWHLPGPPPISTVQDADNDGMIDAAEFAAGTDLYNPSSKFTASAQQQPGGTWLLGAKVIPGKSYQLESTTNLQGTWTPVPGSQQTAPGGATNLNWNLPASAFTNNFWRVKTGP